MQSNGYNESDGYSAENRNENHNVGKWTPHSCVTGTGHDVSLKRWEMTFLMTQMFHRAIGKTAVGRSLGQMYPASWVLLVTWTGNEEILGSPEGVQTYERSDTLKKRSAQMDHRAGNDKKEPAHIPFLQAYGQE